MVVVGQGTGMVVGMVRDGSNSGMTGMNTKTATEEYIIGIDQGCSSGIFHLVDASHLRKVIKK